MPIKNIALTGAVTEHTIPIFWKANDYAYRTF